MEIRTRSAQSPSVGISSHKLWLSVSTGPQNPGHLNLFPIVLSGICGTAIFNFSPVVETIVPKVRSLLKIDRRVRSGKELFYLQGQVFALGAVYP